jgi:hypothetical protein
MTKNMHADKHNDPLYSKCEAIVETSIEPIFDKKDQYSSEKIENYEVLFCLIYNIVAHVINIMPLHEIKDAVKTGTGLALDGYLKKFNEESFLDHDDEDYKDRIIN